MKTILTLISKQDAFWTFYWVPDFLTDLWPQPWKYLLLKIPLPVRSGAMDIGVSVLSSKYLQGSVVWTSSPEDSQFEEELQ